jgi:hypothetical protein
MVLESTTIMPSVSDGSTPSGPKAFDGGGVGDGHPDDFDALHAFCGSGGDARPFDLFAGGAVPDRDFVSGFDQIGGHRLAHDSQT